MTYTTDFVTSKYGTKIGYRQLGSGPGLILVHGGMQASQDFMALGALLADDFSVYIPDRRGRGLSGPHGNYSLLKECEDMGAIIEKTGAKNIFGLSSGAIIALQTANLFQAIRKVALYEPPLYTDSSTTHIWGARYEKYLKQGKLEEAVVTVIKGAGDESWSLMSLPRFMLVPLIKLAVKADAKKLKEGDVPIKELIPTMHYDIQMVAETKGKFESFKNSTADILLLGGSKSAGFLKDALGELKKLMPQASFIQFPGLGHGASAEGGTKTKTVASELKKFFTN